MIYIDGSKKYSKHIHLIYAWFVLYQIATSWYTKIVFMIDHDYMQALNNL